VRLEGSLDAFSLADIFALLSMTKKTGGLHLRRPGAHGAVWLSDGSLTGGTPAVERQGLLRRVVTAAGVTPQALQAAADRAGDGGSIVVELAHDGAVDEVRLHEIVGEHVVDTVFDLLRWPAGDFEFVVDEPDPDPVGFARPVEEVVAEARRWLDDWNQVRDGLPAPTAVLRMVSVPPGPVTLDPEQWALLVLADGRRTVAEIVECSGRGEYAAVRSLAELIRAGVLSDAAADPGGDTERWNLLATLEGRGSITGPPAVPATVAPEPTPATRPEPAPADPQPEQPALAESPPSATPSGIPTSAEPTPAAAPTPLRAVGNEAARVTPQRPEPLRPARTPDHPDGSVAPSTVGALAAAPAEAVDPSVNKSLLLRLIAGVRAL